MHRKGKTERQEERQRDTRGERERTGHALALMHFRNDEKVNVQHTHKHTRTQQQMAEDVDFERIRRTYSCGGGGGCARKCSEKLKG